MSYKEGAKRFYDLFGEKDDVDFYVSQALASGGKVLELGVGSARLAIRLARRGVDTWGVEPSRYMLEAAEKNIMEEDSGTQSRLHLIHDDAKGFSVSERFSMIYFPSYSFDHILDPVDQRTVLRNIRNHLAPKGRYVFDVYLVEEAEEDSGWFVQRKELPDGSIVVRSGYRKMKEGRMSLDMWYDHVVEGRVIDRYHEGSTVHVFSVDEIRGLLEETGFKVAEEYSDYHGGPYEKGDNMIVFVTFPE